MPRVKKEESAKKKRLAEKSARIGEPENIFDVDAPAPVEEKEKVKAKAADESAEANEVETTEGNEEKKEEVKAKKKAVRGKKYQNAKSLVKKDTNYTLAEAIELVKKSSYSSFPGTVELHLILSEKEARGTISLPHGTGKTVKVAAFVSATKAQEARDAGADYVGAEDIVAQIKEGKLVPGRDFTAVVATADTMPVIAPLARTLGPKGMMPNPKNGTVGANIGQMVTNIKKGQFNFKAETTNPYAVHLPIGKVSFSTDQLVENFNAVKQALGSNRMKKAVVSATMSPGIVVTLD